jgi:hypothetical protein
MQSENTLQYFADFTNEKKEREKRRGTMTMQATNHENHVKFFISASFALANSAMNQYNLEARSQKPEARSIF